MNTVTWRLSRDGRFRIDSGLKRLTRHLGSTPFPTVWSSGRNVTVDFGAPGFESPLQRKFFGDLDLILTSGQIMELVAHGYMAPLRLGTPYGTCQYSELGSPSKQTYEPTVLSSNVGPLWSLRADRLYDRTRVLWTACGHPR